LNRSVYGNGLNVWGAAGSGVRLRNPAAALLCVLMFGMFAQARVHRSQAWAETQFNKAEGQRETLSGRAEQARTKREYQTVIASYRRIVLEAPASSKAEGSAFLVAQLTAEMGRHFKDEMALYSAVREYKFLRREYPGSKHRIEALLAIGEIYKNDLGLESEANAAFGELIRRYPRSELVKEAKAELLADSSTTAQEAEQADDSSGESSIESDSAGKSEIATKQPETKFRNPGLALATTSRYAFAMCSTGPHRSTPALPSNSITACSSSRSGSTIRSESTLISRTRSSCPT